LGGGTSRGRKKEKQAKGAEKINAEQIADKGGEVKKGTEGEHQHGRGGPRPYTRFQVPDKRSGKPGVQLEK